MATLDEKDIESVAGEGNAAYQFDKDSGFGYGQLDAFEDMSKGVKVKSVKLELKLKKIIK
jgi:hypothetical protein